MADGLEVGNWECEEKEDGIACSNIEDQRTVYMENDEIEVMTQKTKVDIEENVMDIKEARV